jgi:hypothetical protein
MDLDELVFHPWPAQGPRNVPTFVGGSGSYVIDADGRRYADFGAQLASRTSVTATRASSRPSRSKPTASVRLHRRMRPMSVAKRRG